jgi:SNF2 family DNA or RNA helicase
MLAKIDTSSALERRGLILTTLTLLKQVCNHPSHFLKDARQGVDRLAGRSGKLERLAELLEEALEQDGKALIFTQYKEMGDLLKIHLDRMFNLDIPFLHGGVQKNERDRMVETYQTPGSGSSPIFILSLKAGGTGLTLTSANHVFHYDRWWNPAVEDQATDRAFRIGQKRNVMVHKLICAGTLEERIDALMDDKRSLADQVVSSAESVLTEMSTGELASMLSLRLSDIGDY